MPKEARLDFGDLETWLNNISTEVAAEAVENIVRNLKVKGPYWTGDFQDAWVVELGDKTIPAIRKPSTPIGNLRELLAEGPRPARITPLRRGIDFEVPSKDKLRDNLKYTIDNLMTYRDIAKDLVPGRIKGGGRETAPANWYVNYIQGGGLATTLALATNRVSKDPKITNFRGNLTK